MSNLYRCFLPSFISFGQALQRKSFFLEIDLWQPYLLMDRDEMSNFYRGPPIDASYQVSVNLAKQFQRRFLKIGQSETRMACGGHVWHWII